VSTTPHSSVSSANLLRVHSIPVSMSPTTLNSAGPRTDGAVGEGDGPGDDGKAVCQHRSQPRASVEDAVSCPSSRIRYRVNAACSGRHEHLEIHHHSPSPQPRVFKKDLELLLPPILRKGGEKKKKKKRGEKHFNQIIYFLFQRKDLHYLLLFIYMYFTFVFKMHRPPNNFLVPALN